MLELVAQSVEQRGRSSVPTGARDLIAEFHLRPYYNLSLKGNDRNYIAVSTKEVPTGLPGDTSLYMHPYWSLLRPPPLQPPPTEAPERVLERVRRAFRFAPGGATLSAAAKGEDVTRVFMRNVAVAPPPAPAAAAAAGGGRPPAGTSGGSGGGGGSTVGGGGGKRRAAAAAVADVSGSSADTGGVSHGSKRQRSNY